MGGHMALDDPVYVAGHTGLVGSALVRRLRGGGYRNLIVRTRAELDLTEGPDVRAFFAQTRPRHVFLAAARVGGILANRDHPVAFLRDNLLIETHVIDAAFEHGVKKLLFLGSSCIYPREASQPIREEALLTGPLEPTNEAYAIAKIAGIELCQAYNREYGTRYLCVMPTNLYGPGDRYDPEGSHVLPALLRRFHEARVQGRPQVTIWGTGTPRREFLHADDLADACVFLMERFDPSDLGGLVNVGAGRDISILELARLVAEVVGYEGEIRTDPAMPDGTPRKLLDTSRLAALGWRPRIGLRAGIEDAWRDFVERVESGQLQVSGGGSPGAGR